MRLRPLVLTVVAAVALVAPTAAPAKRAPDVLPLPNGWQPEGIAAGRGAELFVGSIPTGAVWRLDARTGQGRQLVAGREGRAAIGLKHDRGLLFVAGGPTGHAFVYDARTGADVADVTLTAAPTFVNDVTLTRRAAWFTDSQRQQLYRVARDRKGRPAATATTLPITGDLDYDDDPATFEANGIAATPSGRTLLVVQGRPGGGLFAVDARTGASRRIPIAGGDLRNADGILLRGTTLYVVQNALNRIAVVRLQRRLAGGTIVRHITDDDFDVPTTIARRGAHLYAVNARFGTPPGPDTTYSVVRVALHRGHRDDDGRRGEDRDGDRGKRERR